MRTTEGPTAANWRFSRLSSINTFLKWVGLACFAGGCFTGSMVTRAAEPVSDDFRAFFASTPLTVGALVADTEEPQLPPEITPENVGEVIDDVSSRSIFSDRQTSMVDGRFELPPIAALTTSTDTIGNGEVPLGFRGGATSPMETLPESGSDREIPWQWMTRCWAAPNTFSHPLYFEDRMLERHGHRCHHHALQPAISGTRFIAQAALLPYLAAINPSCECDYTLGYYRAGNCVPALKQRPPYKRKAVVAQAFGTAAAISIFQY